MAHNILYEIEDHQKKLPQNEKNWLRRILKNFEKAFLFQIAIQMINDGLLVMKMLAMKEMFKSIYGL